jgi:hypothetical protein
MLNREIVCAGSNEAFKRAVGAMVRTLPQGVCPEMGWPWRNGGKTEYTLTFHKITPGEGAGARFEQLDSH